jgi:hypothetical protein
MGSFRSIESSNELGSIPANIGLNLARVQGHRGKNSGLHAGSAKSCLHTMAQAHRHWKVLNDDGDDAHQIVRLVNHFEWTQWILPLQTFRKQCLHVFIFNIAHAYTATLELQIQDIIPESYKIPTDKLADNKYNAPRYFHSTPLKGHFPR